LFLPVAAQVVLPNYSVKRTAECRYGVSCNAPRRGRLPQALAGMKQRFNPGTEVWFASDSSTSSYSGVFEDDGETAYFYAYDRGNPDAPILDAVHIYSAHSIDDREREAEAEIYWSSDGLKAGLLINDFLHAVIDFQSCKAYGRTNFPPPGGPWRAAQREPWQDSFATLLD